MGRLILCSGARTERSYEFVSTGVRVYSIEELCYYLFHHVYLIEEETFCDALIDWIATELKLPDRAEKLRQLRGQGADAKTMATVVLCSADYYTEAEIKGLLKTLDDIAGLPGIKRSCVKASNCLADQQYREAAAEFEKVLKAKEAADLTPEDYGDILHNLAIAKLHITGLKEASELFCQAYERNRREESLRQYLYTLLLAGNEALYQEKLKEYQVSEEEKQSIESFFEEKIESAKRSDRLADIQYLKQKKAQGNMSEYYRKTDELLEDWKTRVRQC